MKRTTFFLVLLLLCSVGAMAQTGKDTLFLELTDNSMLILPKRFIEKQTEDSERFIFEMKGDSTITVRKSDIQSRYSSYPYERPKFESFKFNNKFNDQLYTDATGEIDEANGKISIAVGCIGKRLTPSFKVPDGTYVYVDGEQQYSKETRLRFDKTVHYTLAYPDQNIYTLVKKDDTKYMESGWTTSKVTLTGAMLSTNAPSNNGEDPKNILDGDHNTIFHSTWGSGAYTKLTWNDGAYYGDGVSEWPYLQINLPEPLYRLQFSYTTRNSGSYAPLGLILQGSNDGNTWSNIRTFTAANDNLPTTPNSTFTSPVIDLRQSYSCLRLQLTAAQHKNYLVFSEFSLYKFEASEMHVNEGLWVARDLQLAQHQLTTDAATGDELANVLDGNPSTYLRLAYNKEKGQWPYLQITVPEETYNLQFSYTTPPIGDINMDNSVSIADVTELVNIILGKSQNDTKAANVNMDNDVSIADVTELVNIVLGKSNPTYAPLSLTLQGSTDGTTWTDIRTFTVAEDGLPTTPGTTYTSPILTTDLKYNYLRLQPNNGQDERTILLGDLMLYAVENCKRTMQPYSTDYDVEVNFLTDHPTTEYGVPRIDIWFGDCETWSNSMWIGRNGKKYYEEATIKIDGAGAYPDMEETPMLIRGRGNSSWGNSWSEKNPYRLKFSEKVKPLGMTKGKSWVLLSNKKGGSMTTNALAMKVADIVESRGCNHIVPVELYINNQYRGSYNFTEKIGFSNNSIDLDDETNAAMLELDSYYDEYKRFRDNNYNLYVNVKEPDFEELLNEGAITQDEVNTKFTQIQNAFNMFTEDTKMGGTTYLDVDAFVRAMLVTDLVRNEELMHPKSWFLYNPDVTQPESLWSFGPVWDFDWSFGFERGGNYFISVAEEDLFSRMGSSNIGYPFFRDLLRGSDKVKKEYYRLWTEFMNDGQLEELIEYCDDYFQYANASFVHNSNQWGDGRNYATHTTNAKSWLTRRAQYIYDHLEVYDLSEDILETKEEQETTNIIDMGEVLNKPVNVYSLNGILVRRAVPQSRCLEGLAPGIYIVNGKKVAIK